MRRIVVALLVGFAWPALAVPPVQVCDANGANCLALSSGSLPVAQVSAVGNPCQNPAATLQMVAGQTSGTASVQLVALSGTTKIYVCGITIQGISGTTPTFALRYGTGSACATGTVTIIGAFTTTAGATFTWGPQFVTPAGQALCYIQTGTTPVSNYAITYVQI